MNRPSVISRLARPGNYQPGRRNRISRITFHHIVGDALAALDRFQNTSDQISSTYVISSGGIIYQCVSDNDTPFSDGNADSNSRTISIEHAGGNPQVPYTDAMYNASIRLVAWLISQYGISDFKRHRDVIDKSVYPGGTACPGSLDVERIINGARELLKGDSMANFRPLSDDEIDLIHQGNFQGERAPKGVHDTWKGKDPIDFQRWIIEGGTWKDRVKQIKSASGTVDPVMQDKANRYDSSKEAYDKLKESLS